LSLATLTDLLENLVFVTNNINRPDGVVHLDVQDASLEVLGDVDPDAEEQDRQHVHHQPEMEFLDINITKNSSLSLHAIHSPFCWWKTIIYSGFNNSYKKILETRKLESTHE
jgi:hypothetical protein